VVRKGKTKWVHSVWRIDKEKIKILAFGCRQGWFIAGFVRAIINARPVALIGHCDVLVKKTTGSRNMEKSSRGSRAKSFFGKIS
jgi:hypothetical protein